MVITFPIGPPKYVLEEFLEDVAGNSPTLPFTVDSHPPLSEDTEHSLRTLDGKRAPGRFKVESDHIIFRRLKVEDSGEYIISCLDSEGELVQATLELEVMPPQPSSAHHASSSHGQLEKTLQIAIGLSGSNVARPFTFTVMFR